MNMTFSFDLKVRMLKVSVLVDLVTLSPAGGKYYRSQKSLLEQLLGQKHNGGATGVSVSNAEKQTHCFNKEV